jgi:hypothetical protein
MQHQFTLHALPFAGDDVTAPIGPAKRRRWMRWNFLSMSTVSGPEEGSPLGFDDGFQHGVAAFAETIQADFAADPIG